MNLSAISAQNAARFTRAKIIRPVAFQSAAKRLVASKARYQTIEAATGVPWFLVAVIHEREADGNFHAQLAQGDPLDQKSHNVPAGRGPFLDHPSDPPGQDAFYRGALDALVSCPPYAAKNKDWSLGGSLLIVVRYNGLGYDERGLPSPYLFSGTDQYHSGKFIRDGVYDAHEVDEQVGCAGLILTMQTLDPSIQFKAAA